MAPILRRVVAMSPLRLRVLAGSEALDRPVRWVAVSELEDPTPFLEGGELVLTTGMRLRPGDAVPYVSRLIGLGAVGLGFGVGLGHDEVPETFVRAAAELGLPLIEVPRDVPFIAVGKAVSELLAAEQYDELSRAFAAQGRLTRAALQTDGARAVIDRLAREIDGWAALLDTSGDVRSAAGEGARRRAAALTPELDRLRARGTPASLAVSTPEEHVIVQPLGGHRRVRGFFAVGARRPFSPIAHTIVNAAGSLLTLALEQDGQRHEALAQSQARLRAAVLRLLIAGESAAAEEVLGHEPPREPVVVLVCRPGDPAALSRVVPGLAAPWGPEHTEHTTGDSAGDPADRLVV
ncbi:MAG TPA: PucR family transcriptional regulator ligand-binding domain-containing protein, partial [Thermopolyspora sp.]